MLFDKNHIESMIRKEQSIQYTISSRIKYISKHLLNDELIWKLRQLERNYHESIEREKTLNRLLKGDIK